MLRKIYNFFMQRRTLVSAERFTRDGDKAHIGAHTHICMHIIYKHNVSTLTLWKKNRIYGVFFYMNCKNGSLKKFLFCLNKRFMCMEQRLRSKNRHTLSPHLTNWRYYVQHQFYLLFTCIQQTHIFGRPFT